MRFGMVWGCLVGRPVLADNGPRAACQDGGQERPGRDSHEEGDVSPHSSRAKMTATKSRVYWGGQRSGRADDVPAMQ